jgi:uncharacterized membrane protein YbhN (UPF0104 family)
VSDADQSGRDPADQRNETERRAEPQLESPPRRRAPWIIALLIGVSALAALILFVAHIGDIAAFARQAANAKAGPLIGAIAAQAMPFILAALVWFLFLHRVKAPLRMITLIPLSFAKLFADQAVPSGGLSGAAFFMFALTRRGVPDKIAFRTFAFTTTAYFLAFLIAAIISLIALSLAENAPPGLAASVSAFAGIVLLLAVAALFFIFYKPRMTPSFILKRRITAKAAEFLAAAVHDIRYMPGLFIRLTAVLLFVRAVDGVTVMLISQSIGAPVSFGVGFVAVAIASITATIGPVPMGLGTFEAGMIATLTVFGVPVEDALTATLIYRGLTLWLPLLPGFLIIQREFLRGRKSITQAGASVTGQS